MQLAVFSAKPYDKEYLTSTRAAELDKVANIEVVYHEFALSLETVSLAKGAIAVCVFVNDNLSADVLESLHANGVRAILLRCAGYNNVDLQAAERLGLFVANVRSYSPESVAEFAVAQIQTLNRNTHRAYNRVREGNFSLQGLLGRTLNGKTVGIIGTGRIGVAFSRIMNGFGCRLLAYDVFENDDFKKYGTYTDLDTLLSESDFISLHCPLMENTRYLINDDTLGKMKKGAMLVNTSRGGLIDTKAVIAALKRKHLGALALDVYEGEGALFYNDHSSHIIDDDELMRLTTFPNVLICGHQAFFTEEALREIADGTIRNLSDFLNGRPCENSLVQTQAVSEHVDRGPGQIRI
ncbi:D-isomer specific 2-hydroxyacid dehydrogenase [Daldinia vernicosa]|uniref:D-isomer specific 2-hydroxyacid dehydrogenase n=1 Tax=Daldinia vernicosa TaxID=114800 RepID=UPI00200734D5|nr:D-isomer specific 2-hydroxyacid dehydrogenase [Daldinia vernicosa]KAI0850389.1 D-isomer specific 2-hydroxyacid dehydrogenase [Daldinia vernicosa]